VSPVRDPTVPDRNLALELVRVTESAAMGAARWIGRGDKNAADGAAVDMMRRMINYARNQGIKELIGDVLRENRRMLKLAEVFGFVATPAMDEPAVVRVSLPLQSEH